VSGPALAVSYIRFDSGLRPAAAGNLPAVTCSLKPKLDLISMATYTVSFAERKECKAHVHESSSVFAVVV
jgi:hypothetical protein